MTSRFGAEFAACSNCEAQSADKPSSFLMVCCHMDLLSKPAAPVGGADSTGVGTAAAGCGFSCGGVFSGLGVGFSCGVVGSGMGAGFAAAAA